LGGKERSALYEDFYFFFSYLRKLKDDQCHGEFSSFNFEGIKSFQAKTLS